MTRRSVQWILVVIAAASVSLASAHERASNPTFRIAFPFGWEYQAAPIERHGVWYLQARQRSGDRTTQFLRLTIIGMEGSANVPRESVRSLVGDLGASSGGRVEALPNESGYYFLTASRDSAHKQQAVIEGILLGQGCLIRFVLQTNDMNRVDVDNILAALSHSGMQ